MVTWNKLGCFPLQTFLPILILADMARVYPTEANYGGLLNMYDPGACIIKLIMTVIYGFPNKLEYLSLVSLSSLV